MARNYRELVCLLTLLIEPWINCITTENSNNQKLMAEYEKYQELQARSQKLQEVSKIFIICLKSLIRSVRTMSDNWEIWQSQRKLLLLI